MTRTDDRHAAPQPVACARCGAAADVVKFSPQHTSVQWTADAVRCCSEFRARAAEGTRSALVEGCAALRDSIDAAVAAGLLAVSPPAYEGAPVSGRPDSARPLPGDCGRGDPRIPEYAPWSSRGVNKRLHSFGLLASPAAFAALTIPRSVPEAG